MATIKISRFQGMLPALNDTVLPENNAALAQDAFVYSGAIQGFAEFKEIYSLENITAKAVYRIPRNFLDADHLAEAYWMEFVQPYTDVIRTSVVGDTYERYYWAAPFETPKYNTKTRIISKFYSVATTGASTARSYAEGLGATSASPTNNYRHAAGLSDGRSTAISYSNGGNAWTLGIPAPTYTPTLSVAGGSGTTTTRSYVVTYLSAYGEEGPPSLPITVTGYVSGTWNLGVTGLVDTSRNILKQRIYRTITGSSGLTNYFLVAEVSNVTATYADTASDTTVSANQQIQSTTWFPPPSDLLGWAAMPNGIIAAWRGKEIWFCEPYRPHAWPPQYALTVEFDVVGLGVYGQTLIVCTQGFPYAVTGINPASMTMAKVSTLEPCMSRGSIVSAPEGVYYASPNGLILAAQGQFTNVTKQYITKDKWQELLVVATARAVHMGSGWLAFGGVRLGCFEETAFDPDAFEQDDYTGSYVGLFVDPANPNVTTRLVSERPVTTLSTDPWSGETLFIKDSKVLWFDFQSANRDAEPYLWRSKKFQASKQQNFEAVKVYFHIPPGVKAQPSGAVNNTLVQTLGVNQYGLVRFYADNRLVATRELRTSGQMFRLPSGFKAEFWQIEFEARVHITGVQMATSAKELASV